MYNTITAINAKSECLWKCNFKTKHWDFRFQFKNEPDFGSYGLYSSNCFIAREIVFENNTNHICTFPWCNDLKKILFLKKEMKNANIFQLIFRHCSDALLFAPSVASTLETFNEFATI